MRKKCIALSLLSLLPLAPFGTLLAFDKDEAMADPFVRTFEAETGRSLSEALDKAYKNSHWQRANTMIYHETVTRKFGKNEVKSADIKGGVREYTAAGNEGVALASWQGLGLAKLLSPMGGRWRNEVVPVLAKQLVDADICQGYLDLAYFEAKGWAGSRGDFKKARDLLQRGEKACKRKGAQPWQIEQWNKEYYKYDALMKYPGVLHYTGRQK